MPELYDLINTYKPEYIYMPMDHMDLIPTGQG